LRNTLVPTLDDAADPDLGDEWLMKQGISSFALQLQNHGRDLGKNRKKGAHLLAIAGRVERAAVLEGTDIWASVSSNVEDGWQCIQCMLTVSP